MTRTGKSARLSGHIIEPHVEIHPDDALVYGLQEGELARVGSQWGEVIVRVRIGRGQRRGSVFISMHWNDQYASKSYVDALVNPAVGSMSPVLPTGVSPVARGCGVTRSPDTIPPMIERAFPG